MADLTKFVAGIIRAVEQRGDRALCEFVRQFDGLSLQPKHLRVSRAELQAARHKVSPDFLRTLKECGGRIRSFAEAEKAYTTRSWLKHQGGVRLGQLVRPVDSAGLYIPGGRFPYPSTVLMTAIPARVAGVQRIVMASPPKNLTLEVLAAADFAGINEVYRIGGAGAIAALAIGTARIRKVDFIVGPGNRFVMEAKRQVYGRVGIDSLAGPSEVVIIADSSTPIDFIQLDLLAQAEHDPDAQSVLLSTSASLIAAVRRGLDSKIKSRIRFQKVASINRAIEEANRIAPEHFELLMKNAKRYLPKIRHAGAIFLGPSSPAALGDYVAGPSHVLPTNGAALFSSGLSIATFLKRSSIIGFTGKSSERRQWEAALTMAQAEGMEYHGRSLRARLQRKP